MKKAFLIFLLIFPIFSATENSFKNEGCLKMDVIVVADLSASVRGQEIFIHDAVEAFANRFTLSDEGVRIGVITFASGAYMLTKLTSNKDTLQMAINTITHYSATGTTNMTDALVIAANEMMNRGRIDVLKVVVVISDGDPDSEETALEAARFIKTLHNTNICGVFIESAMSPLRSSKSYMKEISSEFCYVESDYENLVNEFKKLDICF